MNQHSSRNIILRYWKSIVWAGIIAYGLLTSGNKLPKQSLLYFEHGDKVLHLLIFFGMEWLILLDSMGKNVSLSKTRTRLLLTGLVCFYAGLTEILQFYLTTKRDGDFFDFLADMAGIVLALVSFNYTFGIINRFFHLKK